MAEIQQYVFFDFEMLCSDQGMPYESMESIRIGAVKYELGSGSIHFFDRYIKPINNEPLSNFCKELTGIRDIELLFADSFDVIFKSFLFWVGGVKKTQFFSWSKSDLTRLQLDAKNHEIPITTIDEISKRYVDFQAVFSRRVTKNNVSVENALKLYGLDFIGEPHNPMYDAYNTLRIYFSFINEPERTDILMLEHYLLGEPISCMLQINEKLDECLNKDIKELMRDIHFIYPMKTFLKVLKNTQKRIIKYQNVQANRSKMVSRTNLQKINQLNTFYKELKSSYAEHNMYGCKVLILEDFVKVHLTGEVKT